MRSKHADLFNHDPWADDYDSDVNNNTDPIRNGYWATLRWVVDRATIRRSHTVLDLGTGTGNTAAFIPYAHELICVDISTKMLAQAAAKLSHVENVRYAVADLLEYWQMSGPNFDAVISTYAIHHLTQQEKGTLFRQMALRMRPGARAVFGDLMFESAQHQNAYRSHYQEAGLLDVVEAIDEEWFWHMDIQLDQLQSAGFDIVEIEQHSNLSWGIAAQRIN